MISYHYLKVFLTNYKLQLASSFTSGVGVILKHMENTGISGKVWLSLGVTFFKVVENTEIIGWLKNERQKQLGWPPFQ